MKRSARWILISMSAALLGLLALGGWLAFSPGASRAALRAIGRGLHVTLEADAIHHRPGTLSLSGLRVTNAHGTLCDADGITVTYDPWSLLLGRIRIDRLDLRKPRLELRRLPDGGWNLPGPPDPEAETRAGSGPRRKVVDWVLGRVSARAVSVSQGRIEVHGGGGVQPLLVDVQGEGSVRDGQVNDARLDLSLPGATAPVATLEGGGHLATGLETVLAELQDLPLGRCLESAGLPGLPVDAVSGKLQARAGENAAWLLEAEVEGVLDGRPLQARAEGRLEDGHLALHPLQLDADEVALDGDLSWEIETGGLAGDLRLESKRLAKALAAGGVEGVEVLGLRAEAEITGTLADPLLRFQAGAEKVSRHGPLLLGLSLEGTYTRKEGLQLAGTVDRAPLLAAGAGPVSLTGGWRDGVVEGEIRSDPVLRLAGSYGTGSRELEVEASSRDLHVDALLAGRIPPGSRVTLSGHGSFGGRIDRPPTWHGEARVTGLAWTYKGLRVEAERPFQLRLASGSLTGEVHLAGNGERAVVRGRYPLVAGKEMKAEASGTLSLASFQGPLKELWPVLHAMEGTMEVSGSLTGSPEAPSIRAHAKVRGGSRHLVPRGGPAAGTGEGRDGLSDILRGKLELDLELSGALASPDGSLRTRLEDGTFYGTPVDAVVLEATSRDGLLWTNHVTVKTPDGSVALAGTWNIATGVIAGEIEPSQLEVGGYLSRLGIPIRGPGRLQGTYGGRLSAPGLKLDFTVDPLSIREKDYGKVAGTLDYSTAGLRLETQLASGQLAWWFSLKEDRAFSVSGSVTEFALDPLLELMDLQGLTGSASLSGSVTGPIDAPLRWSGNVSVDGLALDASGIPIHLGEAAKLAFEGKRLRLAPTVLLVEGQPVHLGGTLGKESDLFVRGRFRLEPLESLVPGLRTEDAWADMDLAVRGPLRTPALSGSASLGARQVSFHGLAYPLEEVSAELEASGTQVTLKTLTARVGDGSVRASGSLRLDPLTATDVRLRMESVPLRIAGTLAGRVEGDLRFEGGADRSSLKGDVRILEARYEEDFDVAGLVLKPARPPSPVVRKPSRFLKNMRLDVKLSSGSTLMVRNNIARMILAADLEVRGTAAHPIPLGSVRTVEGRIFFGTKEFEITRGNLAFLDPNGGLPRLQVESNIEIEGETRRYRIFLTLDGPLDRIELELRSIPTLSREDILFVMATGKTQEEFENAPSATTEQAAAGTALAGLGFLFGGKVRSLTGLDTFELESTEGDSLGVKTTVGKRFNERVAVRGIFSFGSGLDTTEAQVEYRLTDSLLLVGTQRTDGSFGLDLRVIFVGY